MKIAPQEGQGMAALFRAWYAVRPTQAALGKP